MLKIEKIKEVLHTFKEIEFAYLFGSYATDKADENSDIDVAIFIKKDYDVFDTKLKVHHKLETLLNKEVDIIALNTIKNFDLLNDIFDDGVVLKDSEDDFRVMFELKKQHEILDYKEFKRMLDVA